MTNERKRELHIGMTKDLFEKGYSVKEIREKLGIPESTIRSYKEVIDKAELNRRKMDES